MIRSSNPVLSDRAFSSQVGSGSIRAGSTTSDGVMTINGTINKTLISLVIVLLTASWSWSRATELGALLPISAVGGLVVGLVISFKQSWAPILTPVYAAIQGVFLGAFSWFMAMQLADPNTAVVDGQLSPESGLIFQAVVLTFATLFAMLTAYRSGWITVNEKFRFAIVSATLAIFVFYLATFVLNLFGVNVDFHHGSSPISIGFSVIVVGIAALNLLLDFDLIENAAKSGQAPKYMEWFGAFALLVTLIWLYIEIVRLLAKLRSRD